MRGTLIISLAIALIAVIFALQNSSAIDVHIGPFDMRAPLALVLLLTLFAGVLVGYLSTLSRAMRLGAELRALRGQTMTTEPEAAPEPPSEVRTPDAENGEPSDRSS